MATTWNPADAAAAVTFSGGNLIASVASGAGTYNGGRSIVAVAAGEQKFFSCVVTSTPGSDNSAVGFANSTAPITDTSASNYIGKTNDSIGLFQISGITKNNSTVVSMTWAVNDTLDFALDLTNNKFWCRVNGGNWNNSGTDNPATNTGGVDITSLGSTVYAGYTLFNSGASASNTANFGDSAYTFAAPAGFSNIGAAPATDTLFAQSVM